MSQTSASTPAPSSTAPAVGPEPDWTDQVTDLIVDVVDRVHDKTTGPLVQVARAVVYGTVAAVVGVLVLIVGLIVTIRLLDLIPGDIWTAYVGGGALFTLVGLFMWSKRHPAAA